MTELELKKLKVQFKNVDAAREELLYRIAERQTEIERLKASIVIQDQKLNELKDLIAEAEKGK